MQDISMSPLEEVFETQTYPYARTLRTSFFQKFVDSYYAFAGSLLLSKKPHLGIFDYFTLGIPALFLSLFYLAKLSNNSLFQLTVAFVVFTINFPFLLLRYATSAVAAIACLPITLIAHIASTIARGQSYEQAMDLKGVNAQGQELTLEKFLEEKKLDIEEIEIKVISTDKDWKRERGTSSFQLIFLPKAHGCSVSGDNDNREPFTALRKSGDKDNGEHFAAKFVADKVNDRYSHAKNIHALFSLNMGGVVTNIEEFRDDDIKETLITPW